MRSGCGTHCLDLGRPEPIASGRTLAGEGVTTSGRRPWRRVIEGVVVAALLSGAPSTVWNVLRGGPRAAFAAGLEATRAAGTLVLPGRPNVAAGIAAHGAISVAAGVALATVLPRRRSVPCGAAAGLAMGIVNVGLIGRRYPAIRALPVAPQLADNAAFGALFAAVADRP